MNKNTVIGQCNCIIWILSIIYLIEVPLISNIILTRLIWIPGILYIAIISVISVNKLSVTEGFLIIISFGVLLIGMIIGDVIFSGKHWIASLCYMTQILSILIFSKSKIKKFDFDFIFYSVVIISILFNIYSITNIAYKVTTKGNIWYTVNFVFNLDNSNLAGIYLFCLFVILLVNFSFRKQKILIVLLMISVLWMIFKTNARSCIISAFAVLIIKLFFIQKQLNKFEIILCMISPIIFALLYIYLYNQGYYNYQILGKNLFTGRQEIFLNYISKMKGFLGYLIGNFSDNALQNAHNGPITIFSSMGIIGLISTYSIFYLSINKLKNNNNIISKTCVICILGIIIQTSAESTMMLGGFPSIVFLNSLFLLGNYNIKTNNQ